MKKKIILVAVCAVLLLVFASTGYGKGNGKWILLERPDQELLSPPVIHTSNGLNLFIIFNTNLSLSVIVVKKDSQDENFEIQNSNYLQVGSETNHNLERIK